MSKLSEEAVVLRGLVAAIAKVLVDNPDQVEVDVQEVGAGLIVLHLTVSAAEFGQVIGKEGLLAGSIRHILAGVAAKLRRRSVLEIG